jgi:capsular exopolysaccharide synthesis family protein
MKNIGSSSINANQEINLKHLLNKAGKNKWFFLLSIGLCMLLTFIYIKFTTPEYDVSSSILLDTSGTSRVLGNSTYVDGSVGLIEMEKNLYNEIGIIKSYSLVRETVENLGFDIAYFSNSMLKETEHYGYFPFEVELSPDSPQIYWSPFEITIISNDRFRLDIETKDFLVSNPVNNSKHTIQRDYRYSSEFAFGEKVENQFFSFTINKPDYPVDNTSFASEKLSFVLQDLDNIAAGYVDKLSVENIDIQASIFNITTRGPVVPKEIAFLSKLTENYMKSKLEVRTDIASNKEAFIRDQLVAVSDSLAAVEAKLEAFKRDERAVNLGETASNALGQTSSLQVERAKIKLDIKYMKSLLQSVIQNRNNPDFEIPTASGINDPLLSQNLLELKALYTKRAEKRFFVTANSQDMTILNKQIKSSTNLLIKNLNNVINKSQLALGRVSSQISNFNGVINSLPERENQLLNIQRKSTLYENLFNYLSQELAKTGIARAENQSDSRVLDEARMVGSEPVSPNKKLLYGLAFLTGLIIPVAKILMSESDIIEDVEQIVANTSIPVIASITEHTSSQKKKNEELSLWKTKESFRDLYANLQLFNQDNKTDSCILGITSIMPDEGKTYNAINLGITLAEAGKKTLIIDGDLRNPSLVEKGFDELQGNGLANYLRGDDVSIKDITRQHSELKNLDFIPTVIVENNVHSLLTGESMDTLMTQLRKTYDYIVFDTPAVGLVSDFLLFTKYIDINLFVTRRKIAKEAFLRDFEKLASRGNKKSFIIYNGVEEKTFKYGYGEKYGDNQEKKILNDTLAI